MSLSLAAETQTIWWITLGLGAVVAAIVLVLLHLLLGAVKKVEQNVSTLWSTAAGVARNTATSWQLGDTAAGVDEIKDEATRHDTLLATDGRPAQRQSRME
jgi:hypothetical protein